MSHYTEEDTSSAATLDDSNACDPNDVAIPPEFATVSLVHPVQERKASAGPITNIMRRVPPCVWIMNKTSANIVVKVSKPIPSRLLTKLEIGVSVEGGGTIGGEAALHSIPALLATIGPDHTQRFPFWSWRQTQVIVLICAGLERCRYILEAGNLGVYRGPSEGGLKTWGWNGKSLDASHPASNHA